MSTPIEFIMNSITNSETPILVEGENKAQFDALTEEYDKLTKIMKDIPSNLSKPIKEIKDVQEQILKKQDKILKESKNNKYLTISKASSTSQINHHTFIDTASPDTNYLHTIIHDQFLDKIKNSVFCCDHLLGLNINKIPDSLINNFTDYYNLDIPNLSTYLKKKESCWAAKTCTIMSFLGYVPMTKDPIISSKITFKRDKTIKPRFYLLHDSNITEYVENYYELKD